MLLLEMQEHNCVWYINRYSKFLNVAHYFDSIANEKNINNVIKNNINEMC